MKNIKLMVTAIIVMAAMSVSGQWSTNGTNVYYNGGNVGIGTDSPAQLLNMINPSGAASNILIERDYTGTSGINGIGSYLVRNSGTGDMAYFGLRKNGISSDFVMSVYDGSASAWRQFIYFYFENRKYTIQNGVHDVEYQNTGNILLNNTGGVTIGTTTMPGGYKLAVDGKIICEELFVSLSEDWPDYVFNDDYYLRPLDEVERFINKNGRLPGVKSANQIKEEGLSVGDMNKLLMEKVEELTLYVIQLQKEVDGLKKK